MRAESYYGSWFSLIGALISNWYTERIMGSYEGGGGGNRLKASEKLIKVFLLRPIRCRLTMKKKKTKTCSTTSLSQGVYKRDFCSHVFANPDRYTNVHNSKFTQVTAVTIIIYGSKGPHRVYVSLMLWGLSSFWAHYWLLTKWKVLGSVWKVNLICYCGRNFSEEKHMI